MATLIEGTCTKLESRIPSGSDWFPSYVQTCVSTPPKKKIPKEKDYCKRTRVWYDVGLFPFVNRFRALQPRGLPLPPLAYLTMYTVKKRRSLSREVPYFIFFNFKLNKMVTTSKNAAWCFLGSDTFSLQLILWLSSRTVAGNIALFSKDLEPSAPVFVIHVHVPWHA